MLLDYLLAGAAVFGINLLPAFGPPTWAALVFLRRNSDLAAVPLCLGALAQLWFGAPGLADVVPRVRALARAARWLGSGVARRVGCRDREAATPDRLGGRRVSSLRYSLACPRL